ncbi:MAG: low-specificity L-threonine aldolase [Alphaproteobacteria bacterium]|nr:low-specificity L-threonine aldolase [Alphaproteobacteria bacterium]
MATAYGDFSIDRDTRGTIDLRSDTVTRPTKGMRAAMAAAEVGDDVYGDDPTVNALEERLADMTGKEAALFVASGTQSNLSALLAHCARGEEFIAGGDYHTFCAEAAGAAVLGGIAPHAIPVQKDGGLAPEDVAGAVKPDDPHCPISRLLCLENTVSGRVLPVERLAAPAAVARDHGLSVHLDGARAFNAAVALGQPLSEIAAVADSVSICLSKGLGAPAGSVLCGPEDLIRSARRWRKMLGGGMRQAGLLAACGLYALDHHVERLAEDHANAKRLADRLAELPLGVDLSLVQSNMVFVFPDEALMDALTAHMADHGVTIAGRGTVRLVLHLDISARDVETVADLFESFYGKAHAAA